MFNKRKHNTADVFDLEKLFVTVDANTAQLLNSFYELTVILDKIAILFNIQVLNQPFSLTIKTRHDGQVFLKYILNTKFKRRMTKI